jgi:Arc/MetJ-type ribon-helix-helix transcriptional regulator
MAKVKITITLDERFIHEIDILVDKHVFQSRSQAIQEAVSENLMRIKRTRLAENCMKLEPTVEKALAEEGFAEDKKEWLVNQMEERHTTPERKPRDAPIRDGKRKELFEEALEEVNARYGNELKKLDD